MSGGKLMRKIKFRGKDKVSNTWLYGNLEIPLLNQNTSRCYIVGYSYGQYQKHEVDPKTVGQFTGLQDGNGKDIYEGDILSHEKFGTVKVVFQLGKFDCVDNLNCSVKDLANIYDWTTILGNIYENLELIK
jgi:uncharacterized phage protein (TIGR01671 family)